MRKSSKPKARSFADAVFERVQHPEITAKEHREADATCGRPWQCMCAACRAVRAEAAAGRAE